MKPLLDLETLARQEEGQFFERKSLWEGAPGAKRVRDRRQVRDEIAAHVAAFANADGGVLLLGIEDDGEVTGHGYPDGELRPSICDMHEALSPRRKSAILTAAWEIRLGVVGVSPPGPPFLLSSWTRPDVSPLSRRLWVPIGG
jgi:ATP-dependent DNA helicase RecG